MGVADDAQGGDPAKSSPRERLISAATELLAQSDGKPVSTRQITDLAGVTAPTLYHHFRDKDGLMEAVVARGFEEFVQREGMIERSASPIKDVQRLWDIHVHFGLTHVQLYTLMFGNAGPGRRPVLVEEAEHLLERELGRAAAAGLLSVAPAQAARAVLAANIGVTLMLLADEPDQPLSADDIAGLPLSVQTRDAVLRSVVSDPSVLDDPSRGTPSGQPSYVAAAIALNATLESSHPDQLSGTEMRLFLEWLHRLSNASGGGNGASGEALPPSTPGGR
ncbi:TetR/AcrR family transcriptional regulator [Sinomonas sp. JGH33]|uniref:TetR/AcrR family transcriptional regulator n=2 Tax=Sinomonas terricola TaxID=3110330 RepID=A0ABU5T1Z5_9MICC|nr:TetR/AcrR family transcriptional regulator [Sinomonas sp. JGH33]MEA5453677.1 TetR/AcrR family transcriptional regulator [Sinomonas sp. JGH33]